MIRVRHKGTYKKTQDYLKKAAKLDLTTVLRRYGEAGVRLLEKATPIDTGLTARSWGYKIEKTSTNTRLIFINTNVQNGVNVAVLLQYGHGTGTGGYVQGVDYINPALKPFFSALVEDLGKEVASL